MEQEAEDIKRFETKDWGHIEYAEIYYVTFCNFLNIIVKKDVLFRQMWYNLVEDGS